MIRIGLIGSQSMHSISFAKLCNLPNDNGEYLIPDCRITAVCAVDDTEEHASQTARIGKIPHIVNEPNDLFDKCDAIMVLTRRGSSHIPYALPFIKRGYPVFIDKPICLSDEDIATLKRETAKGKCIVAGGSGMKYNSSVKELKCIIDSGSLGSIKGISLNHNADINCEYDGIYFYACHGVEMMLSLLGKDAKSVQSCVLDAKNFTAFFKYEEQFANLIFTVGYNDYFVNIYGEKKNISCRIDPSDIFRQTLLSFVEQIRNGVSTSSWDDLLSHIYLLRAMEKSINEKCEIKIKG